MKTKNYNPAALLTSKESVGTYQIKIKLNTGNWFEIKTNQRDRAQLMFNQIKGQGIYQEQWIESIEFHEESR